jgi:hypothetical protein
MTVSYANVTSTLALIVALGGTSYAAISLPAGSVGPRQLRNRSVTDLKVLPHSLRARDFRLGDLPAGKRGPIGPAGPATGPAGGDLAGSFPKPVIAGAAITTSKLAPGSVTWTKLGLRLVVKTGLFTATSFQETKADCPAGTTVLSGGAGVVDAYASPLAAVAALSYSGPEPLGNGWQGNAYRAPPSNTSYGLNVFAVCIAS